jgi:hypothetical protein
MAELDFDQRQQTKDDQKQARELSQRLLGRIELNVSPLHGALVGPAI